MTDESGIPVNSTPARGAVAVLNPGVDGVGSGTTVHITCQTTGTTVTGT